MSLQEEDSASYLYLIQFELSLFLCNSIFMEVKQIVGLSLKRTREGNANIGKKERNWRNKENAGSDPIGKVTGVTGRIIEIPGKYSNRKDRSTNWIGKVPESPRNESLPVGQGFLPTKVRLTVGEVKKGDNFSDLENYGRIWENINISGFWKRNLIALW